MHIIISTTTPTEEEARKISSNCVSKGIAACAHIEKVNSYFYWENDVHEDIEYRVNLKSVQQSYELIADEIKKHHSYEEPAILYTPIIGGSPSYLQWIQTNSTR